MDGTGEHRVQQNKMDSGKQIPISVTCGMWGWGLHRSRLSEELLTKRSGLGEGGYSGNNIFKMKVSQLNPSFCAINKY